MPYKISESWLVDYDESDNDAQVEKFISDYQDYLMTLPSSRQRQECISKMNRMKRHEYWSCKDIDLSIRCGDICYVDFGVGYINECSYQHFGIVLSIVNHKAYILPMTSNPRAVEQAKNNEKKHLYYIGKPDGLHKETCAFVNDGRYINTARIISVNAHVDVESDIFQDLISVVIGSFYDKI